MGIRPQNMPQTLNSLSSPTKSPDCLPAGVVFRDRSSIHGLMDFFRSAGMVPVEGGSR